MVKTFHSFCVLIFVAGLLPAQPNIEWQQTFGGSIFDEAKSVQQTRDGGYILVGTASSEDGDVVGSHGSDDVWIMKFDSLGVIQWQKLFGGSDIDNAFAVQQTNDNGYIVAGFTKSIDGDILGNHGDYDAWVLKLNSSGELQWQKCYGGSGREEAWDIQQTSDNGYVLAGRSGSTDGDVAENHGSLDYWVVKLDASGVIEWEKSLGGSALDLGYSIFQTNEGGYIVAGESSSSDGDVTNNLGNKDYWIVKLNFEGKIEWEKTYGSTGLDRANDIQQTSDGGFIAIGQSRSSNGDVTGAHGGYDFWVVKLSFTGTIEWQRALGGSKEDYGRAIRQTKDGGYVMIGASESNNGDVVGNDGGADLWVVRLSTSGELLWQKTYGGSKAEFGNSIEQTLDGGYILAGYAWSDDGDVSDVQGYNDYWIVKLSPESSSTSAPAPLPLEISPNPAQNTIRLKVPSQEKDLNILVTDLLGRELRQWFIPNPQSGSVALDIAAFPNGLYWVRVTTNSGAVHLGKVLKQG